MKFIECAGNGAVALASPVVYANTIQEGKTGFIYRDEREFSNKLNLLIKNRNLRRMVAEKAYDYVRHERLMSQHYEERLDWYRDLLQRLPELTEEAAKRIEPFIPQFQAEIDEFRARFQQAQQAQQAQQLQQAQAAEAAAQQNPNGGAAIIIPE